jgi:hypothetical protein
MRARISPLTRMRKSHTVACHFPLVSVSFCPGFKLLLFAQPWYGRLDFSGAWMGMDGWTLRKYL